MRRTSVAVTALLLVAGLALPAPASPAVRGCAPAAWQGEATCVFTLDDVLGGTVVATTTFDDPGPNRGVALAIVCCHITGTSGAPDPFNDYFLVSACAGSAGCTVRMNIPPGATLLHDGEVRCEVVGFDDAQTSIGSGSWSCSLED